jgi:hypothetical protein
MKFNARATSTIDELYSRSSQQVSEALSNIRMVVAYNLQQYMMQMYEDLVRVAEKTVMKNAQVGFGRAMRGTWAELLMGMVLGRQNKSVQSVLVG